MVIFKNLFGMKEFNSELVYDTISMNTRNKLFYTIHENFYSLQGAFYERKKDEIPDLLYLIGKNKGLKLPPMSLSLWLETCSTIDLLRTIEICLYLRYLDRTKDWMLRHQNIVDEVNNIFEIDNLGYEIILNKVVKKYSKFLHKEVIKETIFLLDKNDFKGPLEEFNKALEHHRKKESKDAVSESNKAYESTMKAILTKLDIPLSENETASSLIKKLYNYEVIFPHMMSFTDNLREMLKGLPILRNRDGGHGQGINIKKLQDSYSTFALHLAGSFIVFLIQRYVEIAGGKR